MFETSKPMFFDFIKNLELVSLTGKSIPIEPISGEDIGEDWAVLKKIYTFFLN